MSFKALVYAYVLGGITFVPLVILALIAYTIYTSVPVGDPDLSKPAREARAHTAASDTRDATTEPLLDLTDVPKARKGWLTMRRTFEESSFEGSYVTLVKSFLDARSKDPKRSRPRDMWYVVLKGKVLYLYEDESMTECEAAIELGSHDVVIFPEGLLDGELFAKRNAICLKPKLAPADKGLPSLTRDMHLDPLNVEQKLEEKVGAGSSKKKHKEREREKERLLEQERKREEALDLSTPWFIFVRSNVEMEDWYFALIHASDNAANTPTLAPLQAIFSTADMNYLVTTLDEQPDVIPMRWLNALLGRLFFSYYRTDALESYIIGRLMKKLSKVKRPNFLTDVVVTEVYVGNKSATFSKPMLKELTKEGDAALEVRMSYKGEIRVTVQATATINLGSRFKPYTVKLTLAAVLRELEGNLVVKVKRPPSNRIWYAFTQAPRMVFDVEPVVSDRQITWSMILNSIESRLKEVIMESIVMPNMDDIAFFDTSRCVHRGGIWPDAGRREKPADAEPSPPSSEEDMSPVSGPVPDVASSPSLEGEPADIKRSQSEPEVRGDNDPSVSEPLSRAATTAVDTQSTSSSTRSAPKRRPTWFPNNHHSGKHHHTHMVDDPEPLPGAESEADLPKSDSTLLDVSHDAGESTRQIRRKGSKFLTIRKSSRSPSPGPPPLPPSRSPSPVPSLDMNTNRADSPDSLGRPASVKSSKSSKSSKSTRSKEHPPASPSLFSSLKSRAGDRQALGTSAKETMRKWGVNWAGLKKDNGAASAGSAAEDVPDGGDRRSSDSSFTAHKAKASYAEVRAAVAERKERERSAQAVGASVHANGGGSDPIPIPVPARDVRVWSGTSSQGDSSIMSAGGGSVSSTSSRGRSYSGDRTLEPPPMVRTRTPSTERPADELALAEASGAAPYADLDLVQGRPPAPIHTQPSQGKTMTIPGIHASHRGEVMAMGYVPPTPPPPPPPPENKGKASGIQSVYRLWKSPTLPPQDANGGVPESRPERPSSPLPPAPPLLEQEAEVSPVSPVVPTMSRPPPPPLPPRSASSKAIEAIAARRMSLMHTDDAPPADPLARVLENDRVRPDSPTLPPPTPPGASAESSHPDASPVHAPVPSTPAAPDITFTVPTPVRGEIAKPPLPPRNAPATAAV